MPLSGTVLKNLIARFREKLVNANFGPKNTLFSTFLNMRAL